MSNEGVAPANHPYAQKEEQAPAKPEIDFETPPFLRKKLGQ